MKMFKDYHFKETTNAFIALNHFEKPTFIQSEVISNVLRKRDVIAISPTGSGKTHAFLIPIMELIDASISKVQAVISAPTRELAMQLFQNAKLMQEAYPDLRIKLITGGENKERVMESLKNQPHIVIGTPGRMKDLFVNEGALRIETAQIFVLDEADMTFEYGFLDDVDAICGRMRENLQMLAFSATIPQALKVFLKKYMHHPKVIDVTKNIKPAIEHILVPCKHRNYAETILLMKDGFNPYTCLIVANTREEADEIANFLKEHKMKVLSLHGGLEYRERKQVMKRLASDEVSYIVATDIASRGIDIEGITHVISCGFPTDLQFYIHRAGRTGRNSREGVCYALYHESDRNAILNLMAKGIVFKHEEFKNEQWKELKPFDYKRVVKNDQMNVQISKTLGKKLTKVKPGYRKKRKELVEKIKRQKKREFIKEQIKNQRKEFFKSQQRLKNKGND